MLKPYIFPTLAVVALLGQSAGAVNVNWTTIESSRGDRLPDFSYCGYHASNDQLPSIDSKPSIELAAASGDQTSKIQAALDEAAAAGGGVVKLGAGNFSVSSGLVLESGTILRGSGVGSTTLTLSKLTSGVPVLSLGNGTSKRGTVSASSNIVDDYVGIGADIVTVKATDGFEVGQNVMVSRAATAEWIRAMGMADLVRDGKTQTWISVGTLVSQPRTIKAIKGTQVTLDIPLTDSLDKNYMTPYLAAYTPPNLSKEMGVESLSITLNPTCSGKALSGDDGTLCETPAISFPAWTVDSFVRQVNATGFNRFIEVEKNASRITIEKAGFFRDADTDNSAGYPEDIRLEGSQVLIQDCGQYGRKTAKAFAVATEAGTQGPNAVLRHVVQSSTQQLYPHQRWAHGFLAEDTDATVELINRNNAGSGHGWTINGGVGWNVRGEAFVQSPPLGINWCVGCTGEVDSDSNGTFIETNAAVTPTSLFAAQLDTRSGNA